MLDFFLKLGIVILFIGIISFISLWLESIILLFQPVPLCLTLIFKRMEKLGSQLAGKETGETPYEFSDRLKSRMISIRQPKVSGTHSIIRDIDSITDSYVISAFSQNPVLRKRASSVIHSWRRLRLRLIIETFRWSISIRKDTLLNESTTNEKS